MNYWIDIWEKQSLATEKAIAKDFDTPKPTPTIEKRHEWEHGSEGKGKDCNRASKPIYTKPDAIPGTCRDWQCDNGEWVSKGLVERERGTKKILTRNGKKVG